MNIFFAGIIAFILGGFIASICSKKFKTSILSLFTIIGAVAVSIPALNVLFNGKNLVQTLKFNPLIGNTDFVIDSLSAFFILIISLISTLSVIYSNGYLKPYREKGKNLTPHVIFLPMLIASMLSVVTCQNAFMFLICWEIMSLSSFFLVIFENEKKEVLKSGIKYLVFMHISVLFIIMAFAFLFIKTGSFEFSQFSTVLENNKHFANLIFILLFIGFGTKAGFVPFHNWLPDAHPAAPSHVSAMMSGVMIKTGIYGILRTLDWINTPSMIISYVVLAISLISVLYGIMYAIGQNDAKRLLAYSTIENVGIIGLGISIGMLGIVYQAPVVSLLGFAGGFLHILNHAIFKELMFMAAGSIYNKTHTRDIEVLGGLVKSMPTTGIFFLIGSIAICGLPPFNGFISEFLIYFGMFKGLSIENFFVMLTLIFAIAGLALVGTMAILCFSKLYSISFLGLPRSDAAKYVNNDVKKSMLIPMGILSFLALAIGLTPHIAFKFIQKPVRIILDSSVEISSQPLQIMQIIAIYAVCFVLVLAILIGIKLFFTRKHIEKHETWGCGYNRANNHMQYSASSYASPFLSMLKPLFKNVFDIEKPRKLFPQKAHFSMHIDDIEEAYVINPLLKMDEWFLSKFETIQSGNIQSYIKYGIVFLLIVIIGSLFIG